MRSYIKIFLILFLISLLLNCRKKISVQIENNEKIIQKEMDSKLVIKSTLKEKTPQKVLCTIHNLTDDSTDMPIFTKEFETFPGENIFIINLKEIGTGKYGLRIYYKKDLIEYRILDITY